MNRLQFRIVFNRERGQLMAVAETVRSRCKSCSQTRGGRRSPGAATGRAPALLALQLSLHLAMGLAVGVGVGPWTQAMAEVRADRDAPKNEQPTVLAAPNGTPLVNIQTPSAAGVSRNTYSRFDVDGKGLVLNNSRTDTATQLGGWVQGNPWLARGSARIILNEVRSSDPSQLKGFIEIAGQRAELIIANAAGIQVDGAGFINASAAILTTGVPTWQADGALAGYAVQGGQIQVTGRGLDASQTDYTALLARAVEVNAGLWAKDLRLGTGSQVMTPDLAPGQHLTATGEAPRYALDSTALGGIYAQRITLVGTEAGLGVRHAGNMIAGELRLSADGWLHNSGVVYAKGGSPEGQPAQAAALQVDMGQGVDNQGMLVSREAARIQAPDIRGGAGSLMAAGLEDDARLRSPVSTGSAGSAATLQVQAGQSLQMAGQLAASDSLALAAPNLDLSAATLQASVVDLSGQELHASGAQLIAHDLLRVRINGPISAPEALLHAPRFDLAARDMDFSRGEWLHAGTGDLALDLSGRLVLDGATVASNATRLSLTAGSLSAVQARVEHYGSEVLSLTAAAQLDLSGATVAGNGALHLKAEELRLDDAQTQAATMHWQATGLLSHQRAMLRTPGMAQLQAAQLDNRTGRVEADAGLALDISTRVDNAAGLMQSAQGDVLLRGTARFVNGDGQLLAARDLDLQADSVSSQGTLYAGRQLSLQATTQAELGGLLQADQDMRVVAGQGLRLPARIAAPVLTLQSGQTLDLSHAQLTSTGAASLLAGASLITRQADLQVQSLTLQASDWNHAGGQLSVHGDAALNLALAGTLDNRGGSIRSNSQALQLETARLDNTGGLLAVAGALDARVGELDNRDGQLQARSIQWEGGGFSNAGQGEVSSVGNLTLSVTSLLNEGTLRADGAANLMVAGAMRNLGVIHTRLDGLIQVGGGLFHTGAITAQGSLAVEADSLASAGIFSAGYQPDGSPAQEQASLSLTARQALQHSGHAQATGAFHLSAARLDLQDSRIHATQATLAALAGDLRLDRAQFTSAGQLVLTSAGSLVTDGAIISSGTAGISAAHWQQAGGTFQQTDAQGALLATLSGRLDLLDGTIATAGGLTVRAGQISNAGKLHAQGDSTLVASGGFSNAGAIHSAGHGRVEVGGTLSLTDTGSMTAQGTLSIQANQVRSGGTLAAGLLRDGSLGREGDLLVMVAQAMQHSGDLLAAGRIGLDAASLDLSSSLAQAGQISLQAGAGDLTLDHATVRIPGDLRLQSAATLRTDSASIRAGNVSVTATDWSSSASTITQTDAAGQFHATIAGHLAHQGGTLSTAGKLTLQAGQISNTGALYALGDIELAATGALSNAGAMLAEGRVALDAASLDLSGSRAQARQISLHASAGDLILDRATIRSPGDLRLHSAATLRTDSASIRAGNVSVTATDWSSSASTINQTDAAGQFYATITGHLDHQGGTLSTAGKLTLQAGQISNTGTLQAQGDSTLAAAGTLSNAGAIHSAGNSQVQAGGTLWLAESGAFTAQGGLSLRADQVHSSGTLAGGLASDGSLAGEGGVPVTAARTLQHSGSTLAAGQALLSGASLQMADAEVQAHAVTLQARAGDLQLDRSTVRATGQLLLESTGRLSSDSGRLRGGSVTVQAADWQHRGGLLWQKDASGRLQATLTGLLDNQQGQISSAGAMSLQAAYLDNRDGQLDGQSLSFTGGTLDNAGQGLIDTQGPLSLTADHIRNAGKLQSKGDAKLLATASLDNSGHILVQGTAELEAGGVLSHSGTLRAAQATLQAATLNAQDSDTQAGELRMTARAGDLDLNWARVASSGRLTLDSAGTLDTGAAAINADALEVQAGAFSNLNGQLQGRTVIIRTGALDNAGTGRIAASGTLDLRASQMTNAGVLYAAGDGNVATLGDLTNAGVIYTGGQGRLDVGGRFAHTGTLAAQGNLVVAATDVASSGLLAAGLKPDSTQATSGDLNITATRTLQHSGQASAPGQLTFAAAALDLQAGKASAGQITLTAQAGDLRLDGATVGTAGRLTLDSAAVLNTRAAELQGGSVAITARDWQHGQSGWVRQTDGAGQLRAAVSGTLDNALGLVRAEGDMALSARRLNNDDGELSGQGVDIQAQTIENSRNSLVSARHELKVQADQFANAGTLQSAGRLSVSATGGLNNSGDLLTLDHAAITAMGALTHTGTLKAHEHAQLTGARLDLQGSKIAARQVSLSALAGDLDLGSAIVASTGLLTLGSTAQLNTQSARLSGASILLAAVDWLNASGTITQGDAAGQFDVKVSGQFDNHGLVSAAGALDVQAAALRNTGDLQAGAATTLAVAGLLDNAGRIASSGNTTVRAGHVLHTGSMTAQGALSVSATTVASSGTLVAGLKPDNTLADQGDLTVHADQSLQHSGTALAAGQIAMSGADLALQNSTAHARTAVLHARSGNLDLSGASLAATGQLTLESAAALDTGGAEVSGAQVRINARKWDNASGSLQQTAASGGLVATVADTLDNTGGVISGNGQALTLTATHLVNTKGHINQASDGTLAIDVESLDGTLGKIRTNGRLTLQARGAANLTGASTQAKSVLLSAASLAHAGGNLVSQGDVTLNIAGLLDNSDGQVRAGGRGSLTAGLLDNSRGVLGAVGPLAVNVQGTLHNTDGTLLAHQDLAVRAASLDNTRGRAESLAGVLTLTTDGKVSNRGGVLAAAQEMTLESGEVDNHGGLLFSGGALNVQTHGAALRNTADAGVTTTSGIHADGNLTLRGGEVHNSAGISAGGEAQLTVDSLANQAGISAKRLTVDVAGLADNQSGRLVGTEALSIQAARLDNRGGLLYSGQDLALAVSGLLDNRHTQDSAQGIQGHHLALRAAELNNHQGQVLANGNLALTLSTGLENTQGTLSAKALLDIGDGGTGAITSALVVDNAGGQVWGGQGVSIRARELARTGSILSGGHFNLALAGHQQVEAGARIEAAGDMLIKLAGSFSNAGTVRGGGTLDLSADHITNAETGEISAASTTLTAVGTLVNRGLIDGDTVTLSADLLGNLGTGRIYGGDIILRGRELANLDEGGHAAVIAARNSVDGQFRGKVFNRGGALAYADGDLSLSAAQLENTNATLEASRFLKLDISGELLNQSVYADAGTWTQDPNNPRLLSTLGFITSGGDMELKAGKLKNSGATIEANRSLILSAPDIENLNPYLQYQTVEAKASVSGFEFQAPGSDKRYRPEELRVIEQPFHQFYEGFAGWTSEWGSEVGASLEPFSTNFIRNQDFKSLNTYYRQLLLPSSKYENSVFGRYIGGFGGSLNGYANRAFSTRRGADYQGTCSQWGQFRNCWSQTIPGVPYALTDRIWADFKVTPGNNEELDVALEIFYADVNQRAVSNFSAFEFTRTTQRAAVTQSLPGRIVVGGQLQIQGGKIRNDMSKVVDRQGGRVGGDQVVNAERKVMVGEIETGSAYHTSDAGGADMWIRYTPYTINRQREVTLTLEESQGALAATPHAAPPTRNGTSNGQPGGMTQGTQYPGQQAPAGAQGGGGLAAAKLDAIDPAQSGAPGGQHAVGGWRGTSPDGAGGGSAWRSGAAANGSRDPTQAGIPQVPPTQGASPQVDSKDSQSTSPRSATWSAGPGPDRSVPSQPGVAGSPEGAGASKLPSAPSAEVRREASYRTTVATPDTAHVGPQRYADTGLDATVRAAPLARQATPGHAAAPAIPLSGPGLLNGQTLRTWTPNLTLPTNSLFHQRIDPTATYLVETDPRFAGYRQWLSSDYLLQELAIDPTTAQKRLGDGFYEQRLMREQIGQLIGSRFLEGYSSDEETYLALLTNGATYAKQHQLRPGVALTAGQMEQLTTDLVWLVEHTVTLADGSTQNVLVPQVYLLPRKGDLIDSGALIAGKNMQMNLTGKFDNQGTLSVDKVLRLNAHDIANSGAMRGVSLALTAKQDINVAGGELKADEYLSLDAGRDVVVESTTTSASTATSQRTILDRVAKLTSGGVILVKAGQDIQLNAASLKQTSTVDGEKGGIQLEAGRDVKLGVAGTASRDEYRQNASNYRIQSHSQDLGTDVQAAGNVIIKAGQDVVTGAANVNAKGDIFVDAKRDVMLMSGQGSETLDEATQRTKKSFLKSTTTTTRTQSERSFNQGSTFSGATVTMKAGQDMVLQGATVVSDNGTFLDAKRDVVLMSVTDTLNRDG